MDEGGINMKTLSDEIKNHHPDALTIRVDKVKQFIKDLKEIDMQQFVQDDMFMNHSFQETIDKLAGEELI